MKQWKSKIKESVRRQGKEIKELRKDRVGAMEQRVKRVIGDRRKSGQRGL